MENRELLETAEQYIRGELKNDKLKDFEARLNNDNNLRKEVELLKAAVSGIEISERAELKNTLKNIHEKYISEHSKGKTGKLVLKIAAVFLGFILISSPFIYKYVFHTPSNEELFESYFSAYPDLVSQRSETNSNVMLSEAMSYYKKGEYENASVLFGELIKSDYSTDTLLYLYCGISYAGAHHPGQAVSIFDIIIKGKGNLAAKAEWYKVLALIDDEKNDEARKLLEKIINTKGYNNQKAEKLLKKLK